LAGQKVTIFGGSTPKPGEPAYEQALGLGRSLAAAGHTVITGGYRGTMEAISRGAAEAGGHVIGVTCAEIEAWRPVTANPWVSEEIRFPTLRERLYALIDLCDAALALPGGIGTLAEIAVLWSQLQTGASRPMPFILIGPGWAQTMGTFIREQAGYIPEKYQHLPVYEDNIEAAVKTLNYLLDSTR
jgi:uncharacterized protein (TIGR00730 family)